MRMDVFWTTLDRSKAEVEIEKKSTKYEFDDVGRQKPSRT